MAKPRYLSIKNFEKFQHYKHRNPPWIRLHVELLDDADFLKLPDATKWQYVGMLLLASRHENRIFNDESYIRNRLGLMTKLDVTSRYMKTHVLARRKQDASTLHTNADSEKSISSQSITEKSISERARASTTVPAPAPRSVSAPRVDEEAQRNDRLRALMAAKDVDEILATVGKRMP